MIKNMLKKINIITVKKEYVNFKVVSLSESKLTENNTMFKTACSSEI